MRFGIAVLVVLLSFLVVGCNRVDSAREALDKVKALKTEAQRRIEDVAEKARRDSGKLPEADQEKEDR